METLKQNDSFLNGSLGQYKKIFNKFGDFDNEAREQLCNSSFIRGGVLWSERKNELIPGKLSKPNSLTFNEFLFRLDNTINSELCAQKN